MRCGVAETEEVRERPAAYGVGWVYGFLASILPYSNAAWEKLSIILNVLVPKLPAPVEEDLSRGILDAIDMDSYRVEKRAMQSLALPDEDAEIGPIPTAGGGHRPELELDKLSNILEALDDQFGNIAWTCRDRVHDLVTVEIPTRLAADVAYQNAQRNSDLQNARIEHDRALGRVMTALLRDDTQLFEEFSDNESFRTWLAETVFGLAYEKPPARAVDTESLRRQPWLRSAQPGSTAHQISRRAPLSAASG